MEREVGRILSLMQQLELVWQLREKHSDSSPWTKSLTSLVPLKTLGWLFSLIHLMPASPLHPFSPTPTLFSSSRSFRQAGTLLLFQIQ